MVNRYKKYKKSYIKYRKENKVKCNLLSEKWVFAKRFEGMREKVLERDNWTCVKCGMNAEQHIVVYGRHLSIDHIDGNKQNQEINNLQTLCLRCHGKKDGIRRIKFNNQYTK